MNNAFLVGVLDGLANFFEKPEPLRDGQLMLVAVISNGDAVDELHDKKRAATFSRASIEHARNAGMIHERQRLAFGFKPGDDLPSVHPKFDDFERDLAMELLSLLRHPDAAHAAFTDLFQEFVTPDDVAAAFARRQIRRFIFRSIHGIQLPGGARLDEHVLQGSGRKASEKGAGRPVFSVRFRLELGTTR